MLIVCCTASPSLPPGLKAAAAAGRPFISFEFFPPKTDQGVQNLFKRLGRMKHQQPMFVDFTWGAGGSTSDKTLMLAVRAQKDHGLVSNMHLTCTNMEVEKLTTALEGAKAQGIKNIVALRGDPPRGEKKWEATEGGFTCALDLVKYIRKEYDAGDFGISVAGYPEGHPLTIKPVAEITAKRELSAAEKGRLVTFEDGTEHVCSDEDYQGELAYLKQKVDAGADFVITQMFFDVDVYTAFVAACRAAGIHCPIVPGIMILQGYGGFKRMTGFCKSRVPREVWTALEPIKDDGDKVKQYGIEIGTALCRTLLERGAPGLHFYTCNLEKATLGIMGNLGMRRAVPKAETLAQSVDKETRYSEIKGTILSDSYDQVGLALRKEKEAAALKAAGGAAETSDA